MKLHFGAKLKAARKAKGYTQEALAKALDIKGNTLARLERGKHGVRWANLEVLVDILGQPASYYFNDDVPIKNEAPVSSEATLRLISDLFAAAAPLNERQLRRFIKNMRADRSEIDSESLDDSDRKLDSK